MKKTAIVLLMLALASPLYADEIHLNDGRVIKGAIIRITPDRIEYDPEGDVPFDVFPRGQIEKIVYENGRVVMLNEGKKPPTEQKDVEEKKPVEKKDEKVVASYTSPLKGFHQHDGFYVRFLFGPSYGSSDIRNFQGENLTVKGGGASLNVQLGYAVLENLVIFWENGSSAFVDAEVEWGDYALIGSQKENDMVFTTMGIGVNWYFMPYNFYIASSLSYGETQFDGDLLDGSSNGGLYLSFWVGKEWWVSANWGLGLAWYVMYGHDKVKEKTLNETYDTRNWVIGLCFSATYN